MDCSPPSTSVRGFSQARILEWVSIPFSRESSDPGIEPGSSALFSSVQSLSRVRLFATPWTAARQASLSITNSQSSPKPMSIESVMPSNHLIFCSPLLFLPSIFPSIRVFSDESALHIRWPEYWSFSFDISPSNEHPGLISCIVGGFFIDWAIRKSPSLVYTHMYFSTPSIFKIWVMTLYIISAFFFFFGLGYKNKHVMFSF